MIRILAAALALALAGPLYAESTDEQAFDWYRVELVLFVRSAPDPDSLEALRPGNGTAALPADALALTPLATAWPADWQRAATLQSLDAARPVALLPLRAPGLTAADLTLPPPVIEPRLDLPPVLPTADDSAPDTADDVAPPPPMALAYQALPDDALTLTSAVRRINRAREFDVVLHQAWLQPIPADEHSMRLQVLLPDATAEGHSLHGSLDLRRSRYLHLTTRLQLGLPPGMALNLLTDPDAVADTLPSQPGEPLALLADPQQPTRHWLQVQEYRRMRSRELHYIDHPLMGVLVRFEPVE